MKMTVVESVLGDETLNGRTQRLRRSPSTNRYLVASHLLLDLLSKRKNPKCEVCLATILVPTPSGRCVYHQKA